MLFSANEDEQGRLDILALRIGSLASLSTRLGAVDFPRVCGPPPPLFQPLSLLLSAYVCPERESLGLPSGDLSCTRSDRSLSPCVPTDAPRLLIPMVGLLHRQFWSGGGRGGQGDDPASSRFNGQR